MWYLGCPVAVIVASVRPWNEFFVRVRVRVRVGVRVGVRVRVRVRVRVS